MKAETRKLIRQLIWPIIILCWVIVLSYYWRDMLGSLGVQVFQKSMRVIESIIGITIWLSVAFAINSVSKIILWDFLAEYRLDVKIPRLVKDILTFVIFFIAFLTIISVVFEQSITGLLAASGAAGLVIGLAVQNLIADTFNGVALNLDRPFHIGEFVFLHDKNIATAVKVMEITWRTTRFETDNKNILIVPNSILSIMAITNLSRNKVISLEYTLTLDSGVPTDRAITILEAAIKSSEGVLANPGARVSISNLPENGINYTMIFWFDKTKTSPAVVKHNITQNLLHHLEYAGIKLANAKKMVFDNELSLVSHQTPPKLINFLRRIDLFSALTESEYQFLISNVIEHHFKKGSKIVKIGDLTNSMYILTEGLLEVWVEVSQGEVLLRVAYLIAGQFFGEMSLLTGSPRSATVIAETDTVVYEITKDTLSELFHGRPSLMLAMSDVMVTRQLANQDAENKLTRRAISADKRPLSEKLLNKIKSFFGFSEQGKDV